MKCCILNTKYYIALRWKSLPITNTLAYWTHSYAMKKLKCCEHNTNGQCLKTFIVVIYATSGEFPYHFD